jgi:hypothetical protein
MFGKEDEKQSTTQPEPEPDIEHLLRSDVWDWLV